jgi:RNA-directed DNA polymerase
MSGRQQKNQLRLAFGEETRREAPQASGEGSETLTAKRMIERPANNSEQLVEEVCERENCMQAYKRVKSNKGTPGVDGMMVEQLPGYLKEHWPSAPSPRFFPASRSRPTRSALSATFLSPTAPRRWLRSAARAWRSMMPASR